jgi:hypothetical protein
MNERRDPPRLRDEPHAEWPAGFREALAGYASSGPTAEVCGKVVERVEARIGSHAAAGGSWKLPWRAGGIIVAVGIAGLFAYGRLNSRDLQLQRRGDSAPSASSAARTPHVSVGSTPPVIEDVAEPASASATAGAVEPAPSATSESSASVRATPRRRIEPKARERAQAVAEVEAQTAAPAPAAADPRAELALLIRARSILSSAPAQALALVEEHAARFPRSTFEEEREVLAIDAERRLGRAQSAAERARQFLKAHPSSIHRSKVEPSARGR